MAKFTKCDRCGKVFTDIDTLTIADLEHKKLLGNVFKYKKVEDEGLLERYHIVLNNADLCRECLMSLSKWFDEVSDNG